MISLEYVVDFSDQVRSFVFISLNPSNININFTKTNIIGYPLILNGADTPSRIVSYINLNVNVQSDGISPMWNDDTSGCKNGLEPPEASLSKSVEYFLFAGQDYNVDSIFVSINGECNPPPDIVLIAVSSSIAGFAFIVVVIVVVIYITNRAKKRKQEIENIQQKQKGGVDTNK